MLYDQIMNQKLLHQQFEKKYKNVLCFPWVALIF